jgi:hypothetical protein
MIFILTFVYVIINLSITYPTPYELPMNGNYIIDLSSFIVCLSHMNRSKCRKFWKIKTLLNKKLEIIRKFPNNYIIDNFSLDLN